MLPEFTVHCIVSKSYQFEIVAKKVKSCNFYYWDRDKNINNVDWHYLIWYTLFRLKLSAVNRSFGIERENSCRLLWQAEIILLPFNDYLSINHYKNSLLLNSKDDK